MPCAGTRIPRMPGCPAGLQPATFLESVQCTLRSAAPLLAYKPIRASRGSPCPECCWKGSCSPVRWHQWVSLRSELPGDGATLGTFPWHKSTPLCGSSPQLVPRSLVEFYVTARKYSRRKFDLFFLHLEGDRNPFSVSIPGAAVSGQEGWAGCHL